MSNYKWGINTQDNKPIRVCLFVSRNKDNKDVKDFVERRKAFITTKTEEELSSEFSAFVSDGKDGEICRMYLSVNARDGEKIYKELLHFLIDNPDFNLAHIQSKLASISAKKECALEKKWMFDFDCEDRNKLDEFIKDIINMSKPLQREITTYRTPNGYAVVVGSGFDTRELFEKWNDKDIVTLKRDDLLCVGWDYKLEPLEPIYSEEE